ncbi:hypothetical protein ACFLSY_11115 [Bacteroidota bacterium]
MILAQNAPVKIIAIDRSPDYIKKLNNRVEQLNLKNQVKGIVGSVDISLLQKTPGLPKSDLMKFRNFGKKPILK